MSSDAIPDLDLRDKIKSAVHQAKGPLTLKALAKLLKAQEDAVRAGLKGAISAYAVFPWPRHRGSEYFWHAPWEEKAREAVLSAAAACAASKAELSKAAAKKVSGLSCKRLENFVRVLSEEGKLKSAPALAGRSKLFFAADHSAAYFNTARSFITAKIRQAGLDPESFFKDNAPAALEPQAAELVLAAVKTLEPVRGVPVSTFRLRNYLRDVTKSDFDQAALELRSGEQVFLSRHADPNNISPQERDLLIDGRDGTYYVAIALR